MDRIKHTQNLIFNEIKRVLKTRQSPVVIGISGPPAVGKSTISSYLLKRVSNAAVVPLDSFHISAKLISSRGVNYGSPYSFDIDGCINTIERICAGHGIYIPIYNRKLKEPIAASNYIPPYRKLIILEGVFVGYRYGKWRHLNQLISELWFMQVEKSELYKRLIRRESRYMRKIDAIQKVRCVDLYHYDVAVKDIKKNANKIFFY